MPPQPAPTAAQQAHMAALAQLQNSLTPELKASLSAHVNRATQSGGNAQAALQEWIRLNAAQLGALQNRQAQQQQQQTQQQQMQQQQAQAQAQAQSRPPGGGIAAQGILNHLFPPELANNSAAGLQHLIGKLFVSDSQGRLTPSPILPQVVQIAKGQYMSPAQSQLFAAAIQRGTANQQNHNRQPSASSPTYHQPPNPALQRAQAASPPAGAVGGAATPDRTATPPQRPEQLLQLLKGRLTALEGHLQRTDLSPDDRAKAIQSQELTKNQLTTVVLRIQQQQQSRQGTPVQQQQQQFGQQQQAALGFQRQQPGTPQSGGQQLNAAQRLVNANQISNNQQNLAFGGSNQPGSIAPNAMTIAPSALAQTPSATRVGTPAASNMAATPSGGNLSVSTPAPAPAATTSSYAPTHRVSTDPRPDHGGRMVTKRKLRDLLAGIDDGDRLTDPAEELLQDVADEFVKSVCAFACRLAKHRGSERLEVRDIAFHLERTYSMKVPGFSTGDDTARQVPPGPRRGNNPTPYQVRLNAIAASEAAAKRAAR